MPKVTTAEAKHVKVARFLTERGFPSLGYVAPPESERAGDMGVEIRSPEIQRRYLWRRWTEPSAFVRANLYIVDRFKGADDKNWIIHVYGRMNFESMRVLAELLSKEFQVDVHVRLEQEDPKRR
jgi:hypothetical protein